MSSRRATLIEPPDSEYKEFQGVAPKVQTVRRSERHILKQTATGDNGGSDIEEEERPVVKSKVVKMKDIFPEVQTRRYRPIAQDTTNPELPKKKKRVPKHRY